MCFGSSSPPQPKPATPMRQEDEQEARRAKLAAQNQLLAQSSGRYSNDLGQEEKRLGDYEPAQTRSGSSILTG